MATWNAAATAVLTVAGGVELPTAIPVEGDPPPPMVPAEEFVDRVFVAPGPDYAKTCSLLAVHLARLRPIPQSSDLDLGPAVHCLVVPALTLVLAYREDCVPMATEVGYPPADEVEAWSILYEHRASLIWAAVVDAAMGGELDDGCHDWTVGDLEFVGPTGRIAGFNLPLTVRLGE